MDLTVNEMHLLESVEKNGDNGITISDIAEDLHITLPSVTIAINKLMKKGYVEKKRGGSDGRMVYVVLTRHGHRVNLVHHKFHEDMVSAVSGELSEEEKDVLIIGMTKLNQFFQRKIVIMEE
ncbi:hypothetical protein SDC9_152484 [bioreactor metagenome]|uniref:HTH marR-type domain-containing protein n=1 Tax=bioreactor metagenome TaxID=1076179 RepID=A0A645EXS8_9ZZZZ